MLPALIGRHPHRFGQARRAAAWLLRVTADNAGGAVYGTITLGVLFAAENAQREGYPGTIEASLIVLALFWLTSFYAHTIGIRLERREPLNLSLLWRSCVYELPVVEGALIPILVLLAAWAAGVKVGSGVNAALWTVAGTIVVLEIASGWRSRPVTRAFLLQAGAGVSMGLAILGLKLLLTH